jgi:LTXXQ motif family protein
MRRGTMCAAGFLAVVAALPQTASARPRHLPGLLGVITAPIGAILGGARLGRSHRLAHHSSRRTRGVASRPVPAAAATATATVPAAAVAASAAASPERAHESARETGTPQSTTAAGVNSDQPARPAASATAEPSSSQAAAHADAPPPATTASVPATPAEVRASPAQRNAALTMPNGELRPSINEPPRATKPPAASHLGMAGPLTWPTAYEDVIGYTLWPQQYGERLRSHGIADVLGTVFVSPAALAAKTDANNAQAKAGTGAAVATRACTNAKAASGDWPAADIERSIELTPAQRSALDQLKTSLGAAVTSIASMCRDTADLSPVERLQAMQSTLWAVHDAALLIRAPLAAFQDSLSDDQKKQFAAPTTEGVTPHDLSRGEMARSCGMPASLESSMRQIERSLQTSKAQRASLDALNKKSFEMGQFLMASCLKPVPATPTARLDGAADRLTAVLFAASNLAPAVNDFYSQLSGEQKTKLRSLQ